MSRLIQWFVENPIASNLLMAVILIGGAFNLANLNKEVFPSVDANRIQIVVPYPGAGPSEVEELVVQRVEEAIADLDGIEEIVSTAKKDVATVVVEAINGYESQRLLNDIKGRVDAIPTLPEDAERPQYKELLWRTDVMSIGVYGHVNEALLKSTGERVRDELALLPGISVVELNGTRADEMAIEISEQSLRRYNLSFEQVVKAVRQSSLNLPAGSIKSNAGEIQLQTRGQAYTAEDFENIVVTSREDGAKLYIRDIATVEDGFVERDMVARLNGKPAVFLEVFITEKPDVLKAAKTVAAYTESAQLPPGIEMSVWRDWSVVFKSRMDLLLSNSLSGLLLVFVVLMLFLRPALALWVCVGIVVAFMGTLWLLPYVGISLNMVSLFAFLLVLGIVVDDAIIVGESVYSRQQAGLSGNASAAAGAKMVAKPVMFAVVSTMIFFAPLLAIPGGMGDMSFPIAGVVVLALFFSLVESLLILPSHLSHLKPEAPDSRFVVLQKLESWREKLSASMLYFSDNVYQPRLQALLRHNGSTIAVFVVAFGLSIALFTGGWMEKAFMPRVPSDFVRLSVTLPEGAPFSDSREVLNRAESTIQQLQSDRALLGANDGRPFVENLQSWVDSNKVYVNLALVEAELRVISAGEVAARWRELIGELPQAEEFDINATINTIGKDIQLRLTVGGQGEAHLQAAVDTVQGALARYPGVYDIKDSLTAARTEIELGLKPHADTLGLGLQDIARQVRQGFYGEEAQRIPRGTEDVKVMVRYTKAERDSIEQLGEMRVRLEDNREIPLEAVAQIDYVPGYTTINRIDRKRSVDITAEVRAGSGDPAMIVQELLTRNQSQWRRQFPGFQLTIAGDMEEESDFMASAAQNFVLALLIIYGLMAVAFRSYSQPLLILTAIPFGFMGAVIGHLIMGHQVSMMSMLGFFACAGVVVNDNLVLVDRINQLRKQGLDAVAAAVQAGRDRFRAIVLTSLTTFIGLMPIMAETSTQAQFLIPMVISLAFGVLFATSVTLVLVPGLYVLFARLRGDLEAQVGQPLLAQE